LVDAELAQAVAAGVLVGFGHDPGGGVRDAEGILPAATRWLRDCISSGMEAEKSHQCT
jgi:hypothetical protein